MTKRSVLRRTNRTGPSALAVGAGLALAIALFPHGGSAARSPTGAEIREIVGHTVAYVACCVDSENAAVLTIRISTTHNRWAAADLKILYPGTDAVEAGVLLLKGPVGWKVVDVGTGALGCQEDIPQRARRDLKLGTYGPCVRTGR